MTDDQWLRMDRYIEWLLQNKEGSVEITYRDKGLLFEHVGKTRQRFAYWPEAER